MPVEISIDMPSDAHIPADYVEREDLRLEAYRRLAQVVDARTRSTTSGPSGSTASGLRRTAAEGLLAVARLRVECLRTGVTEVRSPRCARASEVRAPAHRRDLGSKRLVARLSPVELPASARIRLRRLHPDSILKEHPRPAHRRALGVGGPGCAARVDAPGPLTAGRRGGCEGDRRAGRGRHRGRSAGYAISMPVCEANTCVRRARSCRGLLRAPATSLRRRRP